MSRRGGGRRSEPRGGDDNPPSFQRGGRGRGRGGDGGRGRGGRGAYAASPASGHTPPAFSQPGSAFPPLTTPSSAASPRAPVQARPPVTAAAPPPPPPSQAAASSSSSLPPAHVASSSSVAQIGADVEKKLTLAEMSTTTKTAPPPPSSSKALVPPRRPGFGKVGTKCVVKANHFLVQVAQRDLHHYDVTISPEVTSKQINRDVMSRLVEQYGASHLGGRKPAYDGRKSLYTAGALPFESKEFVVKLPEKEGDAGSSKSTRKDRQFRVTIKFASKVDVHHLQQFLHGRQLDVPQETIQILDIVLRTPASKVCVAVGRSFFSTSLGPKGELPNGLEYWRGYYQSLRPTQMGLSLNIDVSARAFYEPILVTDFIQKQFNTRDLSRPLSDLDRQKVKKALKGIKVELTHRARSYKITGLSVQPLNKLTFTLDDQITQVSVVQYFLEKYNIRLKHTSLPAIQSGTESRPVFLPMELCRIADGQRYSKKLNDRQVKDLLKANCQRPRDREKYIEQTVSRNRYNSDGLVKDEFGIQVKEELAYVDARVLPRPLLKYHESGKESIVEPQFGQWNMINKKMINGGIVESWTCVNFSSRVREDLPFEFCRQLIEMCLSKGMQFNANPIVPIRSARPNQIEKALVDIHKQSAEKHQNRQGKQLQLLIIILPDITGSYGKIKRICETELGIVSQCCQPHMASKFSKQYFENVALKINVKVGGRNNVLHGPIPLLTDAPTIVFGADVTHPQPGEDSSASIAAVVASMDWPEVTKYRGLVSAQAHREEIIQDLYKTYQDPKKGLVHVGMIRELLISFRRFTGYKPLRIIFYRDGVSEGQFNQVLLYEMDAIWKACQSLEEGYLPPVTFIVVQKRHHTRLFPSDHNNRGQTDRSGNILPGTIVESKICHPTEFDFYLNSHAGIQGTSRPTHYHVLWDENRFTADQLQVLTYNLCYTYARCTRSVSIAPPAYYAHLAAFRARYYCEGETSDAGSSGGRAATGGKMEVQPLPSIKDNVKDVMFYC